MSLRLDGPGRLGGFNGLLTPLPVGTRAPDFALPLVSPQAAHNGVLRLHGAGRRQALVLVFYPMDWEPVSREQLTLYQAYLDSFARLGARLLGISCDHVYCHEAFAREAQLGFPLLADVQPRGAVARRYGVFREAPGVSARALFVLGGPRVIRFSRAYPDALNPGGFGEREGGGATRALEARITRRLTRGDATEERLPGRVQAQDHVVHAVGRHVAVCGAGRLQLGEFRLVLAGARALALATPPPRRALFEGGMVDPPAAQQRTLKRLLLVTGVGLGLSRYWYVLRTYVLRTLLPST